MRYTKYAYNQKNKSNFLISLIIVITLGSVTGGLLFKLLFKNVNGLINGTNNTVGVSTTTIKSDDYEKKFAAVQCGVFANEDNAKTLVHQLENYTPFIIDENGSYKVIIGIFNNKNDIDKINKELATKKIEGYLIKFDLNNSSNLEYEIIKGYLKIINKVTEENIESVNTEEFKRWVLDNYKKNNDKEIKELVKNIESLPSEITREDNDKRLVYLYKILIKYKL